MKQEGKYIFNLCQNLVFCLLIIGVIFQFGCKQAEQNTEESKNNESAEKISPGEKQQAQEEALSDITGDDEKAVEKTGQFEETSEKPGKTPDDKTIVATVNGIPIYKEELIGKSTNDAIENEIFYVAGLEKGFDEKFADQINDYKKRIISSAVKKERLKDLEEVKVTEEDMKTYYKNNESKYMHLIVQQISVKDEAIAKEVMEKAEAGEEFKDIASGYRENNTDVRVKEFRLPTQYNDLFEEKKIGSLSEIQTGIQGYELFKITEIQRIPFKKAEQAIRHDISSQRKAENMSEYARELKEKYGIEVDIKNEFQN